VSSCKFLSTFQTTESKGSTRMANGRTRGIKRL
jgi:hypothetical protein